ncbi:MAG TPA: hypothetical protein VF787_17340, partial [Thermoanaerobaculia bacterium]
MKRLASATVLLLQFLALPLFAQANPTAPAAECTLCVGVFGGDGAVAPALVRLDEQTYPTYVPANAAKVSVIVAYSAADIAEVEQKTQSIIEWAKKVGPFDSIGVSFDNSDRALVAYAIKRLAVTAQGQGVAKRILFDGGALA